MHDQISGLMHQGIIKSDANGNLDLNMEDENFESIITEKIKTSKQKNALARQQLNQQVDHHSQQSFKSANEDVELEDMS